MKFDPPQKISSVWSTLLTPKNPNVKCFMTAWRPSRDFQRNKLCCAESIPDDLHEKSSVWPTNRIKRQKVMQNPYHPCMVRIFTYIYHENQPNVGKYTIHGYTWMVWESSRPDVFRVHFLGFNKSFTSNPPIWDDHSAVKESPSRLFAQDESGWVVKGPFLLLGAHSIYLENQVLLISSNFTPKTSHSCLKKWYTRFSR